MKISSTLAGYLRFFEVKSCIAGKSYPEIQLLLKSENIHIPLSTKHCSCATASVI